MQTAKYTTDKPASELENYHYVNKKDMKINLKNVNDEYFTDEVIAKKCFETTKQIIKKYESNLKEFYWIDPSAGKGAFYNLLPKNKRLGIDINPMNNQILKMNFLKFVLPQNTKNIVIGNPPFGHRGVIALDFINHSKDADYVCFILPMFFESVGKGSIKYRVNNFSLIYSELLPKNSFFILDKNNNRKYVDIKCVFQIWSKNHKSHTDLFNWYLNEKQPFANLLDVVTVSLAKNRECGKKWIFENKPDWYLSSTFYKNNKVVKNFNDVKYKSGLAIIYKTHDEKIIHQLDKLLLNADWNKYSSLATNSCRHIGKSHIYRLVHDKLNSDD